jgi:hypothetical protein
MARRIPVFAVGALATLTALWLVSGAVGDAQSSHQGQAVQAGETTPMAHPKTAEQAAPKCPASGAQACSAHLPELTRGVDAAIKALENDQKAEALAELQKVKALLAKCQEKCSAAATAEPKFANDRCPISGLPIVPAKVTDNLVREYKGQRVAFCCGSCPPKWDKLTDAEKDAKLQAVARR